MMAAATVERILGLIALGFGTGLYGTLIGAGGGFVLMPMLLLFYPTESPEILTGISLAVVFFNALSGSESYAIMGRIDYRAGLMFAAATIPGAILGALNTAYVPRHLFNIIFGVLILTGAVFLFLHPDLEQKLRKDHARRHPHDITHHLVEANGKAYTYSFNPLVGVVLSFFVGYVSSFLGIGGGIIHVPALVYFLHFPVHIATATSHFILAIMAFTGTTVHILSGSFSHGVIRTLSLGIGVVLGAPLGAHLSNRFRGGWIIRSLALALGLVGIRILILFIEGKG
ncbi:MAG TPA: sulfite exporter TauE/SafE family protein [Syntrophobacteria bacterium]|nr:sulfite exporter TauE/SafE family protein [Syntrophobacteria bacterium]